MKPFIEIDRTTGYSGIKGMHYLAIPILLILICVISCSGPVLNIGVGNSDYYTDKTLCSPEPESCIRILNTLSSAFSIKDSDTSKTMTLWNSESDTINNKTSVSNIYSLINTMESMGLNTLSDYPETFEDMLSVSDFPGIVFAAVINYDKGQKKFLPRDRISIYDSLLLQEYSENIEIIPVNRLSYEKGVYRIALMNGYSFSGSPCESLNGKIFLSGESYLQIAGCLTVTELDTSEILKCSISWYKDLPEAKCESPQENNLIPNQ